MIIPAILGSIALLLLWRAHLRSAYERTAAEALSQISITTRMIDRKQKATKAAHLRLVTTNSKESKR